MKSFKKVLFALILGVGVLAFAPRAARAASPFEVTVGTVVPNGSSNGSGAFTAASYPNYTGAMPLRKLIFDNLNSGSAERVSLWSTCTSSTSATLVFAAVVKASDTLQVDVSPRLAPLTSPCVSKGVVDSNSQIRATFFYE